MKIDSLEKAPVEFYYFADEFICEAIEANEFLTKKAATIELLNRYEYFPDLDDLMAHGKHFIDTSRVDVAYEVYKTMPLSEAKWPAAMLIGEALADENDNVFPLSGIGFAVEVL